METKTHNSENIGIHQLMFNDDIDFIFSKDTMSFFCHIITGTVLTHVALLCKCNTGCILSSNQFRLPGAMAFRAHQKVYLLHNKLYIGSVFTFLKFYVLKVEFRTKGPLGMHL